MDEKELRTSPKQRIFIIFIAVLMVGSIVASYAGIVASGNQGSSSSSTGEVDEAKIAEYEEAYEKISAEFTEATKGDFEEFNQYKGEIKAYNESSANESGVQTKDLKEGDGRKLSSGDEDYLAYYVGWCADESIFDSTYNDNENPTGFSKILNASLGMIEGWKTGIDGMKIEGIREITIPGELAYGESMEICGGKNKPLKFLVMAKENTGSLGEMAAKLDEAQMKLQYAYYGLDYDSVKNVAE